MESAASVFECAGQSVPMHPAELPETVEVVHEVPEAWKEYAEWRASGHLCDATVLIGDKKVPTHKALLSARVPFFTALFNSNMAECETGEISLNASCADANEKTMESLIDYAYTGKISISESNVQSVILGASFLHLDAVMNECARFMRRRLKLSNVLPILLFCRSIAYDRIEAVVLGFIDKNFVPLSLTDDWTELGVAEAVEILSRDSLYVDGEQQVFEAAARWVERDQEARRNDAARVMRCVRVTRLSPAFLTDIMEKHDSCRGNGEIGDLIEHAKEYHACEERRAEIIESGVFSSTKARICEEAHSLIFVIGGLANIANPTESKCEFYNPVRDEWMPMKSLPTIRGRAGVAVVEKNIFALGGFDSKDRLDRVDMYDTEMDQWLEVPHMLSTRSAMCTAVVDGVIYAAGGYEGQGSLATVEAYRPSELMPEWRAVTEMSKPRGAAASCVLDGKIYVFGGHNSQEIWRCGEVFDPATNQWTPLSPMRHKRCRFGLATMGGYIYAAGGYDGAAFLKDVERYDPKTDTWTSLGLNKTRRSRATLAVSCGKLFLIGGFDGLNNLSTMDMYHPETDTWETRAYMKSHCGGIFAGVLPVPTKFATPVANLEIGDTDVIRQ